MPLTLTGEQMSFMRNITKLTNLSAWALRSGNHIATRVRRDASLTRTATPTRSDIQHMSDYLAGGQVSQSDLIHLINGFNNQVA